MDQAATALRDRPAADLSLDEYWMPFTPNRDFKSDPKMVVRAEGMYYWNERGERLIDASSGLFCVNAGHGRKEIADAVGAQLRELDFVAPFTRGHPKQFELASRVAELTPGDLNRIFFVNSGSEAVDSAMKVALAYHQARGQAGPHDVHLARARVSRRQLRRRGAVRHREQPPPLRPGRRRRRAHAPHAPEGELLHARARPSTAPISPTTCCASSTCTAPRTSPRASSSRSRGRPAASCRPRATSRGCARSATRTASCSCSTR